MNNKLEKQIKLSANTTPYDILGIFLTLATEHGTELNVGMKNLAERGCMWIVSKTKLHFNSLTKNGCEVTATTWPTAPGRIRCNRYYTLSDEKGIIAEGKSEWAILETATGRPKKLDSLYPNEVELLTDVVCDEPFLRLNGDFSDTESFKEYVVSSDDIDANNHMNNVAYVRAVLQHFPTELINDKKVTDLEIQYKAQCYEGEKLLFKSIEADKGYEIGIIKEDGTTAVVLHITVE